MELSVRNLNSDKWLKRKIISCIALLDDEYKNLDFTVNFYDKREKLQKERDNKPDLKADTYEQILTGKKEIAGLTIGEKGKIKIFLFKFGNVKSNPKEVISLIANIFHEIRHAWQYNNGVFQDEDEISFIDGNLEAYYSQPSEKDAYLFQEEQMKKHGKKVLEIFGFDIGLKYELQDEVKAAISS